MKYLEIEQQTRAWWDYKVGKISGTRFGQLISTRENMLIDELASEMLDGNCEISDYIDDDMQFGIDNEPLAIDLYEQHTGMKFQRGGVIVSDFSDIHMASPDAINIEHGIVLEVKCTRHGRKHINRFRTGIDTSYKAQVINYFACSDEVKEVRFLSYCPYRIERPLIVISFTRDSIIEETTKKKSTIDEKVAIGRENLKTIKDEVAQVINDFTKIDF